MAVPKKKPEQKPSDLSYRSAGLTLRADGSPASLDESTRSVECIVASETPVNEMDMTRWEIVPTVLRMSGCQLPALKQVPLLDSHQRWDTSTVIGSARELRIEGDKLVGRAFYSSAPEADGPFLKMKEGHLTDFSAGFSYSRADVTYIAPDTTGVVDGITYTGPVNVVRKWKIKELSACPIGADETAKARSATPSAYPQEGDNNMNERLRKYLETRGLSVEATEEDAWRYLETLETRSEPAAQSAVLATGQRTEPTVEEQVRAQFIAEQTRCSEISAICTRAGIADKAIEYVSKGASVDDVRKAAFDHVLTTSPTAGGAGFRGQIEIGADERDKFRSAAQDSIIIRCGSMKEIDKSAAGARDLAGFSLRELARESLRMAGQSVTGNPLEMVGRALTTSDLPNILAATANKFLFDGYQTADETWQDWVATGSATDFKTNTVNRASETDDLDQILEDGEYKYGSMTDAKESFKLATYGKLFAISRQTIINDDLSALTDIPMKHGEAWTRKIGDIVYAVLTANANMGDGTALFHANHGNLGTTGAVSETTIAEAIKLMKLQKDIGGKRRLNIRPEFFIAPVTKEGAAEVFFNSLMFAAGATDTTRTNPYAGNRFKRVYEARLDDASTTAFYLAGSKGKTVKVFFLNGQQGPYLETKQGWNIDGVEFKVRGDAAAKALDWKALVKNAGA